jgi:hypothetical protein
LELYWWLNIFWLVQKAKGCQDEMVWIEPSRPNRPMSKAKEHSTTSRVGLTS